jgi:CHASE2 domain-containing sensor protein
VQGRSFTALLVIVAYIALGLFGLLIGLSLLTGGVEEEKTAVLTSTILSASYLLAAYGLYKGFRWGWILAAAAASLSLIANMIHGYYFASMIDALLLVLLLASASQYGITLFGKRSAKPPSPVPPPSAPTAAAYMFSAPKPRKRFVRRKW